MQAYKQSVRAWIEAHEEELIRDICRMVRIRSVSEPGGQGAPFGEGCREALRAMLDIAGSYGFPVKNEGDAVGIVDMGPEGQEASPGRVIGLWGHLDVVPEGGDWDYPPYEGIARDGVIIGRGAHDDKGQSVAALYVMRCIRDLKLPLRHSLRLYVGTNEEAGMLDVLEHLRAHEAPGFSLVADSRFPVCYGEKGAMTLAFSRCLAAPPGVLLSLSAGTAANVVPDHASATLRRSDAVLARLAALGDSLTVTSAGDVIEVTARGVAGHTAAPQGSVNALYVLTHALAGSGALPEEEAALLAYPNLMNQDFYGDAAGVACEDEISGHLTLVGSVGRYEQGVFTLTVNIRYPVTADGEAILAKLGEQSRAHGYEMHVRRHSPAHLFPKDHPAVATLTEIYNRAMGVNRQPFVMAGGTYARVVGKAVSYGMGFGEDGAFITDAARGLFREGHGGIHGPDEFVSVDMLKRGMEIYVEALLAIDPLDLA